MAPIAGLPSVGAVAPQAEAIQKPGREEKRKGPKSLDQQTLNQGGALHLSEEHGRRKVSHVLERHRLEDRCPGFVQKIKRQDLARNEEAQGIDNPKQRR